MHERLPRKEYYHQRALGSISYVKGQKSPLKTGEIAVNMLEARAARVVLQRLVRRRIEAPGRALTLEEIFEAGWPGERISRKATAIVMFVVRPN